jgi:hypothetical protein
MARLAAAFLGVANYSGARAADAPSLGLPLLCAPGRDCWIANYVDHGASHDYRCGKITYAGHDGTDFAIRDRRAMQDGIPVVAAAAGRVLGFRDGMVDRRVSDLEGGKTAVAGRECGNGVLIGLPDGWQTQYCHMREGSLVVTAGEQVERGMVLGMVGESGLADFPHVHLTVRHDGATVDPFTALPASAACDAAEGGATLWSATARADLAYRPGSILNSGFAAEAARWDAARDGEYRDVHPKPDAPALSLWAEILSASPGDSVTLRLIGPDGATLVERTEVIGRQQAEIFRSIGRRRRDGTPDFATGTYTGEVLYHRPLPGDIDRRAVLTTTIE